MYNLANELEIKVVITNLTPGLLGKANARTKTIYFEKSSKLHQKHKCIMAEEIGHIISPPRHGHIAYHSINFYE
ncbi:hypothetical protein N752_25075 [Desulforamulus aquiferis]|nr:hypothetical protein N752_25075 [Desulforamulus aquiferis]